MKRTFTSVAIGIAVALTPAIAGPTHRVDSYPQPFGLFAKQAPYPDEYRQLASEGVAAIKAAAETVLVGYGTF